MRPAPVSHRHHRHRIHGYRSPPAKSTPWWHRGKASVVQCNRPELICSLSKYKAKTQRERELFHFTHTFTEISNISSVISHRHSPFMHNREPANQALYLSAQRGKNTHFYLSRFSFIYLFYIWFFSMSFPYYTFCVPRYNHFFRSFSHSLSLLRALNRLIELSFYSINGGLSNTKFA